MSYKSGILKTKSSYEHHSKNLEFLVFGYTCKLYKDDMKALEIDRENHLIPAPYEQKDLISRYDVRATLSDISPYEASSSFANRLEGLSTAEQQAEQLAEEERYYSLFKNEVEEQMYKEEQEKRQTSGYNQVEFSYNETSKEIGPKESAEVQPETEETDDIPFVPTEALNLPADMDIPKTVKLNQIIEKTAKFISTQGPQMEILLKAKQSSNPQFEFLNHNGQFNPYYKHILLLMKNNTYPWQESNTGENSTEDSENSNTNDSNIIEPVATTAIIIPKMQFKPSADCAYTQLISKMTNKPISELEKKQQEEEEKKKKIGNNSDQPKIGSLGLVASYNSDTEDEESDTEEFNGAVPPLEIQIVIDKTAVYVAKNGQEFEQKLIFKQDPRFQFLHDNNEFNAYYKMKVKSYQPPYHSTANNTNVVQPTVSTLNEPIKKEEIILPKVPPAPVSFSIKTKEERAPLKSTTMGNSDDEMKDNSTTVPEAPSPPRITTTIEEELEKQVDIMTAEREEKLAKERLSDKLLSAAREKLGMLPKEKMLQIERKKKAMMFINHIKGSNGNSSNGKRREDDVINLTQCGDDSNDSLSVKSSTMSEKSRSRKNSSSRSSRSSRSRSSSSSRSSDSSPRRKRSKRKSHRKYGTSRSRSRSPARYKHSKRW